MKPFAIFVGEVTRVADLTSKSGKRFIALNLQGAPIAWGDKTFRPRAEVKSYRNQDELMHWTGNWVVARGDVEARSYEYQGKTIPMLTITGDVELLGGGTPAQQASPPSTQTSPSRPQTAPQSTKSAPQSTPKPSVEPTPPPDEDDDVPF